MYYDSITNILQQKHTDNIYDGFKGIKIILFVWKYIGTTNGILHYIKNVSLL